MLVSETGNRAIQDGGACGSLADFPSELRSKPRIRRLAHQTERLLDSLVRDEAEERRLLELHGQPLAKRPVEHGVARRVDEIGEDNRVLVREFRCAVEIEVACGERRQHSNGSRLPARYWGASLQALEVGANFRSVLVAQLGLTLQAFRQDGLK